MNKKRKRFGASWSGRQIVAKNQWVVLRLAIGSDPKKGGKVVFGNRYYGFGIIEEVSVEAKLNRISVEADKRLEKLLSSADFDRISEGRTTVKTGELRPQMIGKSAERDC